LTKKIHHDKIISESITKSKKIRNLIKDKLGELEKKKYAPIFINKNGNLISETKHVAKLFNAYFTEIAERLECDFNPGVFKYSNGNQKLSASISFTPTNECEITTIIKHLKNKQSSELDGFSSFCIKKWYVYLIKPLTFLTNLSLSTGKFPENLKISKIKPLFKKRSSK
jgi:hypothetical protein